NGAGTSLMMKMTAEKVTAALNMGVSQIHHCSLAEGKSSATQFDIVFCPLNFIDMYKDAVAKGVTVIGLRNVLSDKEMTQKLQETGLVEKHQKK
ncbi:MAG: PTS ascorbate transporter subunit IIB, partial [Angelakisella sp.]